MTLFFFFVFYFVFFCFFFVGIFLLSLWVLRFFVSVSIPTHIDLKHLEIEKFWKAMILWFWLCFAGVFWWFLWVCVCVCSNGPSKSKFFRFAWIGVYVKFGVFFRLKNNLRSKWFFVISCVFVSCGLKMPPYAMVLVKGIFKIQFFNVFLFFLSFSLSLFDVALVFPLFGLLQGTTKPMFYKGGFF